MIKGWGVKEKAESEWGLGSEIKCNKEEKSKIEYDKGAVGCKMKSRE